VSNRTPTPEKLVSDNLVGRVLGGDFELRTLLARGGQAVVYRAYSRSRDAEVAVKVLAPQLAADEAFRQRFLDEFRSLAQLHHENLIEVYRFGVEDGLVYIAMRMVSGGTLGDRIAAMDGPVDLVTTARIISQVAAALQHAHDHGLVHLDIKPSNVLLGRADWPLLADFGITRAVAQQETDRGTVRVAGTPLFMSPEQCAGGPVDGRSDQYSLAVTAFELLTGQLPFQATTTEQLLDLHRFQMPPRPRDVNPGLPGPIEDVLLKALAKNPEDRYPSIEEFGEALRRAVAETHGVSLETKAALAALAPSLLAFLVLTAVSPALLASLPQITILNGRLPLAWPFQVLVSVLLVAVLLPARWAVVGLLARALGALADASRPFGPTAARDSAAGWSSAKKRLVGAAEGLVNLAYVLAVYRLVLTPLASLGAALAPGPYEQTVSAVAGALAALLAVGVLVGLARASGPFVAIGCALILASLAITALPATVPPFARNLAPLVIATVASLIVVAAGLRLRSTSRHLAQRVSRDSLAGRPAGSATEETQRSERQTVRSFLAAAELLLAVVILYLLQRGMPALAGQMPRITDIYAAIALLVWIILGLRLVALAGWPGAGFAFVVGTPLLDQVSNGLVTLNGGFAILGNTSAREVRTWILAAFAVLLLATLRVAFRNGLLQPVVGWTDRYVVGPLGAPNEDSGEQRRSAIGGLVGALGDMALLCIAFAYCGPPLVAALGNSAANPWAFTIVLIGLTLVFTGWLGAALAGVRAAFAMTGVTDWAGGGALPVVAFGMSALLVSGGVALPTVVAMPAIVGISSQAPAPPHVVVTWQYWQPHTPEANQATYNLSLNCSNGEQLGEFREAVRPTGGLMPNGPIPTGLLPVQNCSDWRDTYVALRHQAGLSQPASLSRSWLDEQVTLHPDGSADVVDTQRVLFTAGLHNSLSWQIPLGAGERVEAVSLREGDVVYPVNPATDLGTGASRVARVTTSAAALNVEWSFPPVESPAERTYTIQYHLLGALRPISGGTELRRQVVAPRASGPVWRATVEVHLPTVAPTDPVSLSSSGVSARHDMLDGQTGWFEATDLGNQSGLTVIVRFTNSPAGPPPTAKPSPTPTPTLSASTPVAALPVVPTPTASPTVTAVSTPTSVFTSTPTATATPTSTPTATPTVSVTTTVVASPTASAPVASSSGTGNVAPAANYCGTAPVLAMYYDWYDQNSWNNTLSDQPVAPYVSADPATIQRQVAVAQGAGIDGFEVNWWGPGNQTDGNLQTLLTIARPLGFKATIDFDMNSPFVKSPDDLVTDLRYLTRYYSDSAWFHYGGKPMIVFYGITRFDVQTWATVRNQVDPNHQVLWMGEGDQFQYLSVFDGIHPYSIAWSANPAAQLLSYANRTRTYPGKIWMATAMPGYNDIGVNGAKGFSVNRNNGAFYRTTWNGAVASNPQIINITSFNEWTEGSMIEASKSYGNLYVNLTAQFVTAYRNKTGC